ncbi:MAG: amino acid permease [Actinomycetota bacterium]|nr:amino acid permease [Actinomycetota bacterium]
MAATEVLERPPKDTSSTATPQLKRGLGGWMSSSLVAGNMIGSGVFLLPAALAGVMVVSGSSALLAWLFTGIGAMLLALVFGVMGRAYPRTGGPYAYAHRAFGDFAGFWTAWGYWIAAWAGNAAIAVAFVSYLGLFWPTVLSNHLVASLVAIGIIWVVTAINITGVRQTGIAQVVTTVLKFVPLALIGIVGLFFIHGANFSPFAPHGWGTGTGAIGGITAAAALTLWAFIGLESATVPAEEVKDPKRTIPRATIFGTLATTVVYIVATVAIVGIIPAAILQHSNAPFADAARIMFGGGSFLGLTWAKVVGLIAMISTFGALNGWVLIQGRIPMAAAQDGLFPKRFATLSGKSKTPVFGLVVSSLLVTALLFLYSRGSLINQFWNVILLATLTTLVPYAFAAAAQLFLMFKEPERFVGRNVIRDVIVAMLGFGYAFWAMVGSGQKTIAWGFLLLMAGLPVYVYMKWRQSREPVITTARFVTAPPERGEIERVLIRQAN